MVQPWCKTLSVSQKTQHKITIWPKKSTPWYISKRKLKQLNKYLYSHAHCSIIYNAQKVEKTCVHQKMDKQNVLCIFNGVIFSHKKTWSFNTCFNIDGSWKHYGKWNNPDTKIIVWSHLYEISILGKFTEGENSLEFIRDQREEEWVLLPNEYRFCVWSDKNVLKIDSGDDYTTLWM